MKLLAEKIQRIYREGDITLKDYTERLNRGYWSSKEIYSEVEYYLYLQDNREEEELTREELYLR